MSNTKNDLSGVLSGLMAEEDKRAKVRKERIGQLLSDGNECLMAEVNLIESMRQEQAFDEDERHRLAVNRIHARCDDMREKVIQRHLSKIEAVPASADSEDSDKEQAEAILKAG